MKDRPQLAKALAAAKKAKATLVIAKMDRLSRNLAFTANMMESGVEFVAVDMPDAKRTILQFLAVIAEHEGRAISERTKAPLQAAKARGKVLGWANPKRTDSAAQASQAGVARNQAIAKGLNNPGIKTARGGNWYPTNIRNLRERIAA